MTRGRWKGAWMGLAGSLGLFGCSGGTDSACASSIPSTLSDLQVNVFTPSCATGGCHRGTLPAENLDLSDGKTFASLSGKRSQLDPGNATAA